MKKMILTIGIIFLFLFLLVGHVQADDSRDIQNPESSENLVWKRALGGFFHMNVHDVTIRYLFKITLDDGFGARLFGVTITGVWGSNSYIESFRGDYNFEEGETYTVNMLTCRLLSPTIDSRPHMSPWEKIGGVLGIGVRVYQ